MIRSEKLFAAFLLCIYIGAGTACGQREDADIAFDDTPRVLGDTFNGGGTRLTFRDVTRPLAKPLPEVDVPSGGGTARLRLSDLNKAYPEDRIYFTYNHFHNALAIDLESGSESYSVDRYTMGVEKTLFSNLFSFEFRLPVNGTYEFFNDDFGVRGSNAGNISLITKHLISRTNNTSTVIGMGLNLPTGTDVSGNIRDVGYNIKNEAVHFLPYWAYMANWDLFFMHAFVSWDFAATGNPVSASSFGSPQIDIGTLTEQTLFSADVSFGAWLYRNRPAPLLTGVATLAEIHYTTTLQDADQIGGVVDTTLLEFSNGRNRSDVINATCGLHFEFNRDSAIRVAGVFPLRASPDRDFDAEVVAQFVHRFGTSQTRARPVHEPVLGEWNLLRRLWSMFCREGHPHILGSLQRRSTPAPCVRYPTHSEWRRW